MKSEQATSNWRDQDAAPGIRLTGGDTCVRNSNEREGSRGCGSVVALLRQALRARYPHRMLASLSDSRTALVQGLV
jgi:hypothetical protein